VIEPWRGAVTRNPEEELRSPPNSVRTHADALIPQRFRELVTSRFGPTVPVDGAPGPCLVPLSTDAELDEDECVRVEESDGFSTNGPHECSRGRSRCGGSRNRSRTAIAPWCRRNTHETPGPPHEPFSRNAHSGRLYCRRRCAAPL